MTQPPSSQQPAAPEPPATQEPQQSASPRSSVPQPSVPQPPMPQQTAYQQPSPPPSSPTVSVPSVSAPFGVPSGASVDTAVGSSGDPNRGPRTARVHWSIRLAPVWTVLAGLFGYVVLLLELLLTRNTTVFPALLLVGALTVPLAVLLWAVTGRYGPLAPASTILVVVLVGGLVGIVGAGVLESVAGAVLGREMILLVGFIEETVKLLVPLVILLVAYRRTIHGGVAIGVAAGAGFAVLETMGYGFNALLQKSGGIGAVDATLLLRGVLAPAGHVAWTGAICAAIWFLRSGRRPVLGVLATLGAYLAAVLLHTVWDAADSIGAHLVVGLVSVGGLIVLVILAHRSAARDVSMPRTTPTQPRGSVGYGPGAGML